MKWQTYQFPLEIESSSRKQSGMLFDSIKQNETNARRKMIKIKKGQKNKQTANFEKGKGMAEFR